MAMTEEARAERIAAAVESHDPASEDRIRLPWRGDTRVFPVVQVELDALVLNPYSHRIRAQLESDPNRELIAADPWSDDAQVAIAEILRSVGENFDDLRTNLAEEGQLQPGVATPVGLLINANRRAVALRDNGERYIRVAVLPSDTTTEEISDLEVRLQMQRDFREDYTFTNRLLFVDELISQHNRPVDDVARALNLAASSDERALAAGRAQVEQDTRVLDMIRRIQARSEGRIPLTAFDEQEIALEELETRTRELASEDSDAAERLFETRLLGVLSGVPYRDLRRFDEEAAGDYVVPVLSDDSQFADVLPALEVDHGATGVEEPEGLDVLEDGDDEPRDEELSAQRRVSALVDLIARSYGQDEIELPTTNGPRRELRDGVLDDLKAALRAAAADIASANRHENRLLRPINRVQESADKLRAATDAYQRVKDESGLDREALAQALVRVRERLESLSAELGETP
jgi:hypothetical protein